MKGFRWILILITSFSFIAFFTPSEARSQVSQPSPRRIQYKKIIVKEVRFSGVRSFSVSEIRGLLLTKPNRWFNIFKTRKLSRPNVATDLNTIEKFYERRGFLSTDARDSVIFVNSDQAVVLFMVINLFWKISLHTAFITASVAVLIIVYGKTAAWTVIFIPLIAWARLEMSLHNPAQVLAGALLSVSIVTIVFGLFGLIW